MRIPNFVYTFSCILMGSALLSAAPLTVASYDMLNGERHSFSYMDKSYNGSGDPTTALSPLSGGRGLLTDGVTGVSDFTTNLGNGPAYEWVGWAIDPMVNGIPVDTNDTFATITFKLTSPDDINTVSLFTNNFGGISGVAIFSTATISFSNDDVNFVNPMLFTTSSSDAANTTARFINFAVNQNTPYQYVKVHLTHLNSTTNNWIFISEATFDGTVPGTQSATPEPASELLAGLGLLCLAWTGRRRMGRS
jgi:hypothetical protein